MYLCKVCTENFLYFFRTGTIESIPQNVQINFRTPFLIQYETRRFMESFWETLKILYLLCTTRYKLHKGTTFVTQERKNLNFYWNQCRSFVSHTNIYPQILFVFIYRVIYSIYSSSTFFLDYYYYFSLFLLACASCLFSLELFK